MFLGYRAGKIMPSQLKRNDPERVFMESTLPLAPGDSFAGIIPTKGNHFGEWPTDSRNKFNV